MVVSPNGFAGTIGGGMLELRAIEEACALLQHGGDAGRLSVALGPESGQCCGGRVTLSLKLLTHAEINELKDRIASETENLPHVYVFGAGHVGFELAGNLARLPFNVHLADSRAEALEDCPDGVQCHLLAMPESLVRDAPEGSAFVVMTHDHGQDFLIASEALARSDARYVGLIGSKTKRERFYRDFLRDGGDEKAFGKLVSPIGGGELKDKRPPVIAALATAEITQALLCADTNTHRNKGEAAA